MTSPTINNLYPVANAITSSRVFVDVFLPRDPGLHDNQYQLQQKWLNTFTDKLWMLASFTPTSTAILANWIQISGSAGTEELEGNTGGPVAPDGGGIIHTVGDGTTITVAGNPATHTLTWSLIGGRVATEEFLVDAFTFPGTNPVVPTAGGLVTVTGSQIPAGTTGNVIQTNSLAANTYTIQVQRSQAVASSTISDNGVCHFKSADFAVDSNAFVSLVTPSPKHWVNSLNVQVITTTGTYTPTAEMVYCIVRMVGGGGGGAGCPAAGGNMAFGLSGSSGSYSEGFFTSGTIGVSQAVTIGAGGAGGAAGANDGGNGGQSTFGALMTSPGGQGGGSAVATTGGELTSNGPGAAGTGGYLNVTGNSTEGAFAVGGFSTTPAGAPSVFGGSGPGGRSAGSYNATGFGSGGGAPSGNSGDGAKAGGAGFAGVCIITEYLSI